MSLLQSAIWGWRKKKYSEFIFQLAHDKYTHVTQVGHMERVHSEMPRQYRHDDLTEGVKVVSF